MATKKAPVDPFANEEVPVQKFLTYPHEVQVGDIIEGVVVGGGTTRAKVRVVGAHTGTTRPANVGCIFCLGEVLEKVNDRHGDPKVLQGEVVGILWPNQMAIDEDSVGEKVYYSPVMIERGQEEVEADGVDAELIDLIKRVGNLDGKGNGLTLLNPETFRVYIGDSRPECNAGCSNSAKWFYPKAREFRCPSHRDKGLSNPNDPPRYHEMYIAYEEDPMDGKYFS
jgi:hypothetical protein